MPLLIEMFITSARRWVRILLAHKQIGKSAIHKLYHRFRERTSRFISCWMTRSKKKNKIIPDVGMFRSESCRCPCVWTF